ncbi:TonB-dependent receptor [bacterium]|nr:TonB-dependent receptor [bacterium]
MKLSKIIPVLITGGVLSLSAHAQLTVRIVGDSAMVVYKLEEVVIYGDQQARQGMVTELSPVEIERRTGNSVADLLRLETALTITTGSKAETQTRIRGFKARDVLVLVDGRPINPGYYGKADLNMLPKDNIAKIKVIKGPASVAYGANTMGGIVNVITKNGFAKPTTRLYGSLGNYNTHKLSLNHSGRRNKFFYWISAYDKETDGWELSRNFVSNTLEDGGLREGTFSHQSGISGKLGFAPSAGQIYSLSAGYHKAEKAVPPSTALGDVRYRYWPRWQRFNISLSGDWTLSPLLELRSMVFADANNDRLQEFAGASMDPQHLNYDGLLENFTFGGLFEAEIRPDDRHRLRTGLHFRRDLMNKQKDTGQPWFSHSHLTASLFAEDQFNINDNVIITAGAGLHGFDSDSENPMLHFSPMIGIEYTLPYNLILRSGWSNAIRFATMHHLYSTGSGNAKLKPEEAEKFELGLSGQHIFIPEKSWRVQVEASMFRNYLSNMIYRTGRTDIYHNIARASLNGYELDMHLRLPPYFNLTMQYTWIDPNAASDELMEELPQHRWGIRIQGQLPFGISYHYDLNYFDDRYSILSSTRWASLANYYLQHAGISKQLEYGLTLSLEGKNLTDANYEEEYGYPAPGRQILLGFSWKHE